DNTNELVRHFLIESSPKGVKLKGCPNEPYFVEMESLTGPQAVAKAISETLAAAPPPTATVVHFKVSSQGITLTDSQRKLFGFVARKQGSTTDNVSHIFAELDPDQPASAIVNFVSKIIASQTR
ncbi:hypothetical protein GOODEAATRI_009463, partial [Goodea atripinnis]